MTHAELKKETAYFFGSFNPLHFGHVLLAQTAYYQLGLAKVVLVPTGQPPHRQGLLPIEHRLAMAKLACQTSPASHPFTLGRGCLPQFTHMATT
jgi:nicotinate-nucleotide adenylyltransferase